MQPPDIIRWALRWAWDNDVLSQQDAEAGFEWVDKHADAEGVGADSDNAETVSDMPHEQVGH